jgi:hypothetical protein
MSECIHTQINLKAIRTLVVLMIIIVYLFFEISVHFFLLIVNTMKKQDGSIVRSGARIRESVRCLPRGHFQQIRQMFDKQSCPTKSLSTIHERQQKQKSLPTHVLLKLPVTDDEKMQHTTTTTNIDDIEIENDKSLEECYQDFHINESNRLLKSTLSISSENHSHTGKIFVFERRKQMQSSG